MKNVIAFLCGTAVGGTGSYFIFRNKFRKEYEEKLKRDTESIITTYEQKLNELRVGNAQKSMNKPSPSELIKKYSEEEPKVEKAAESNAFIPLSQEMYKGLIDAYHSTSTAEPIQSIIHNDSYILENGVEGFNEPNGYEKKLLTYFYGDQTLVDDEADDEHQILSIQDTVGDTNLEEFDDDNVIYIRNDRLGVDYEVTQVYNSFLAYTEGDNSSVWDEDD